MEIKSQFKSRNGEMIDYVYREGSDPIEGLEGKILQAVHGFCFYGDKLVVVYAGDKGYWTFPGGGIEPGETWQEATVREVKEESNMKVIQHFVLGYMYTKEDDVYQARYLCVVEPIGDFIADPDGGVTEIKFVSADEVLDFVKWNDTGLLMMRKSLDILAKIR